MFALLAGLAWFHGVSKVKSGYVADTVIGLIVGLMGLQG